MILWYRLRDLAIEIDPQNINDKTRHLLVNKDRPKLSEEVLAQY